MHSDLLETRLLGERMRRLPQEHAPPLSWDEFQQARREAACSPTAASAARAVNASALQRAEAVTHSQRAPAIANGLQEPAVPQRTARMPRWSQVAIAASVCATVVALALWGRASLMHVDDAMLAPTAEAELPMLAQPDKQSLAQAEMSERWLARLPVEPAVMRVGTRTAVADLEDRIAWMDDVLSAERLDAVDHAHIVALQRERARLVNSLAQVRYAETLVAAAQ
jgi:hypothetical protein